MIIRPVTLEGRYIRLEPLSLDHHSQLCQVGLDEVIWRWTTSQVRTPKEMREYIETALKWQAEGTALPFAIIEKKSGRAVGSTRFANIDHENRHLEIGWTWITPKWQRTAVNTQAKYLMLEHAFETLGCIRVEFKADVLNEGSRKALLRIGAKEEGVCRKHLIVANGRIRDSVFFSIIDSEWPAVKLALQEKLRIPPAP